MLSVPGHDSLLQYQSFGEWLFIVYATRGSPPKGEIRASFETLRGIKCLRVAETLGPSRGLGKEDVSI